MDLAARKKQLENARDNALAQVNAIAGQIALIEELLAEPTPPKATAAQLGLAPEPATPIDRAARRRKQREAQSA